MNFLTTHTPEQFIEILGKEPIEKKALILSYADSAYKNKVCELTNNSKFTKYVNEYVNTANPMYVQYVDMYLQRIIQDKLTVFESVYWWLIDLISFQDTWVVIDLNTIPNWAQFENGALFNSPNDIHTQLMAGNYKHIEFKSLYLRKSFIDFNNRLANEVFLEKFQDLLRERNANGIMPNDHRDWHSISINGGMYPTFIGEGDRTADYLINLRLEYIL